MRNIVVGALCCIFLSGCMSMFGIKFISGKLESPDLSAPPKISGTVALTGFQIVSESVYNYEQYGTPHYIFLWAPDTVLSNCKNAFKKSPWEKVLFKKFNNATIDAFYTQLPNNTSAGFIAINGCIPVFDDFGNKQKINSLSVDFLNRNITADYYLTIALYQTQDENSKSFFSDIMTIYPRLRIVLFDKSGNKVFFREYSKPYDLELSKSGKENFYECIINLINENSDNISNDLDFLSNANSQKQSSAAYILSK